MFFRSRNIPPMKILVQITLLLATVSVQAGTLDVEVFAGYTLGEERPNNSIQFDLPVEGEPSATTGVRQTKVYADKDALAKRGTISKCDLTQLGSPPFASTLVRLWLPLGEATRIDTALHNWQTSKATNRTLTFVKNGALVHGHLSALADVSESKLYLHVGPSEEAREILEAICGDA